MHYPMLHIYLPIELKSLCKLFNDEIRRTVCSACGGHLLFEILTFVCIRVRTGVYVCICILLHRNYENM